MPIVQELSHKQLRESISEAVCRGIPVGMSFRLGAGHVAVHTRILSRAPRGLILAWPEDLGADDPALAAETAVCLTFKIKHHKHIVNTVVEGRCRTVSDDGTVVAALRVAAPRTMHRVQRRAYQRVAVPRNRSVLATFWEGALAAGQDCPDPPKATWEGWVEDISAGGFQVRLASRAGPSLAEGEMVCVRVDLGQEFCPVIAEARFRHQVDDPCGVVRQGFQLVGLNESEHGREMIRRIGRVIGEFQRQGSDRAGSVAS